MIVHVKHLHLCSLSTRLPCPDCGPNGDETELMLCLITRGLESAEICNMIVICIMSRVDGCHNRTECCFFLSVQSMTASREGDRELRECYLPNLNEKKLLHSSVRRQHVKQQRGGIERVHILH
jgi:hypothetical protein